MASLRKTFSDPASSTPDAKWLSFKTANAYLLRDTMQSLFKILN